MLNLDSAILDICNNEYDYFLSKSNVQGVGLAYKVIGGCTTNIKCICVMVNKKLKPCSISSNDLIPQFYNGIVTDVIETGYFRILGLTERIRPVIGGYSVGAAGVFTSGSYGGLVKDDNGIYALCNNHVFAAANLLKPGHPIIQPSLEDGGSSTQDIIGKLDRFVSLNPPTLVNAPENFVDCAIAKIDDPSLISSHIAFIGTPRGITAPVIGLKLQIACSTSTYIFAPIKAVGVTTKVQFFIKKKYLFKNQFLIDHGGLEGDSGALALTGGNAAVGLVFAGSDTELVCNPIDAVLQGLNVTLVTQ